MAGRKIYDEQFARVIWQLYQKHGIGNFNNYLTNTVDNISREEVLQALRFTSVSDMARNRIEAARKEIESLELLLSEVTAEKSADCRE